MTDTATSGALEALLDDYLDGTLAELEGPPEGQDQADRLLWALRGVRRRWAEVDAVAQARADQVEAWRTEEARKLADREQHLLGLLEGWAQAQHEDTGRKTWKLPAGELRVRPRMVTAEWLPGDGDPDQWVVAVGRHVPEAVKSVLSVLPGEVKSRATQGKRLPEYDHRAPEGRRAYEALVDGQPVPGVVLFVPATGRDGRQFTAVTK